MKIFEFDTLASTNDYVKLHKEQGDIIVVAKEQTAGRGSKGRSFTSEKGGLYLSKLCFYENFPASRVFEIMLNASVAVCKTLEDFCLIPSVKWPNDVYVNGKKICGILIENTFSGANIKDSVVGIGVNVNNALPLALKEIATTMAESAGRTLDINEVKNRLIFHLNNRFSVEEYKKYIFFFNQKIRLIESDGERIVTALDIDERGRLVVEDNGILRAVVAGEVSVRFS